MMTCSLLNKMIVADVVPKSAMTSLNAALKEVSSLKTIQFK